MSNLNWIINAISVNAITKKYLILLNRNKYCLFKNRNNIFMQKKLLLIKYL